ncbi:virulence factor Mce-like protein [Rhodococcus erythropolis]|uniref:MlaD family protein n=1 Tax=Rhodococcus erythropolis TaxID=1833 RepID=UPI00216797B8|nr:MlaD family protein [Rhodococcus erythropolis]MCS4256010.1 virulence factor Mce-like protein [Rhodococcus erythropolis]MCW2425527.1 virulence factor Mce-like protein [Rhodococcus erythropolis]
MKRNHLTALAVALAAVTTIGVAGIAFGRTTSRAAEATYCAEMPDTIGLYSGNPVTQMGFEIGRIESVQNMGSHVEVSFSVTTDRFLPATVEAVTRSKSILADRSLELVGNYTSGPTLEPGNCIALENSHTPKSISEVVSSAADFIKTLAPPGQEQTIATAVRGVDEALRGQGNSARTMIEHAAAAVSDPDKLIADIGSSIANMAPLSEAALADWAAITSLVEHLPQVTQAGIELWPGVVDVCQGIAWLVRTLEDVQTNYAKDIWPFMHGQATEAIAMAAGRTTEINALMNTLPSVKGLVTHQANTSNGVNVQYTPPTVAVSDEACELLNGVSPGSCQRTADGARADVTAWMGFAAAEGETQ